MQEKLFQLSFPFLNKNQEKKQIVLLLLKLPHRFKIFQKPDIKLPEDHRSVEFSIIADFLQLLD